MAASANPTISLKGWDTANAVSFDIINASIVSQNKTPVGFSITPSNAANGPVLNGTWDAWSLITGGSDQLLKMQCPIKIGNVGFNTCVLDTSLNKAAFNYGATALTLTELGTAPNTIDSAYGLFGLSSGKHYFEIELTANIVAAVGVSSDKTTLAGVSPNCYIYRSNGRFYQGPNLGVKVTDWQNAGDTIGIAVDLDAGKIWFAAPDGTWQGANADPVKGTGEAFKLPGGQMFPYFGVGPLASLVVNFGQSQFKHTVPAGFVAGWSQSSFTLDASTLHINIQLGQFANSAKTTDFKVDNFTTGSVPAVTVISLNPPVGTTVPTPQLRAAELAFSDWFNANITQFGNIFHTINLNSALASGSLAFLTPFKASYAVADVPNSNPPQSVFSVLSVTNNTNGSVPTPPASLAASIDPNIIANMPASSNSVFALSAERFTSQILFEGAKKIMVGSTDNDFDLDPTGLVIKSNKALSWREIELEDKTKVTPTVPQGGLTIRIIGRKIQVEFIGVTFTHPLAVVPGNQTITIDMTQNLFVVLQKRTDNLHILNVQNADPDDPKSTELPNFSKFIINYNLDKKALDFQAAMQWTTIALSIFTVACAGFSAVGGWVLRGRAAATAAANAINAGSGAADMGDVAMNPIVDVGNQVIINGKIYDDVGAILDAGVADAVPALENGTSCGCFTLNMITKIAFAGAVLGALGVAGTGGAWGGIYQSLGTGDVDKLKTGLTFETFLDQILENYTWPNTSTWALKDVQLNESLLIYGNLT